MGFRPEPTVYRLNFDDTSLKGLHVKIRSCTVGEWSNLLGFMGASEASEVQEANQKISILFAEKLVEWDLDHPDTGEAVPQTIEGVNSLDRYLFAQIMTAWQVAMVAIRAPLPNASANGSSSQEASLGMVVESQSPSNWPTPS